VSDQWTTPYGDVPPTQNQQPQQWAGWPPPPPSWDRSQNRSWNGLAIASFVLGILPGSLIAVGLGIGALVQIGRSGGKGRWMAIVGIVLGSLWTVFITIGIVADANEPTDIPTPPGAQQHDVTTLKAGECTAKIPESERILDVPVIDCAKPHRDEVFAVLTISGSKYPGESQVDTMANDMCNDKLESMLKGDDKLPGGTQMFYLAPTRFSWATGDHSLTCLIELPKDYSGRQLPG
jgi:uncharacterized protein DUF4190/putative regulator of septum formation